LKTEKKTSELTNNELEGKVNELNKLLERMRIEHENAAFTHRNTERAMNQMAGEDFRDLMRGLEKENETLRSAKKATGSLVLDDAEKEILEKEIELLKSKIAEIETENQNLRDQIEKSEDVQKKEKMMRENQNLKEEVERQKRKNSSSPHLNASVDIGKFKELQEAIDVRENEIRDLNGELGTYKGIIEELEEQKLIEARLLGGAIQELAVRNLNLEKQIVELRQKEKTQENKENKRYLINSLITPIDFKIRK